MYAVEVIKTHALPNIMTTQTALAQKYYRIKNILQSPVTIVTAGIIGYVVLQILKSCYTALSDEPDPTSSDACFVSLREGRLRRLSADSEASHKGDNIFVVPVKVKPVELEPVLLEMFKKKLRDFSLDQAIEAGLRKAEAEAALEGMHFAETETTAIKMRIAHELFKGIDSPFKLQKILEYVFVSELSDKQRVIDVLELVAMKYPSFVFNVLNSACKKKCEILMQEGKDAKKEIPFDLT